MKSLLVTTLAAATAASAAFAGPLKKNKILTVEPVATFATGIYDEGAAEIVAHDPKSQRLFIVNADASGIDVLDISDVANPDFLFTIDVTPYGDQANSVAVKDGLVAAAVEADTKTDNGKVVFFDANGNFLKSLTVGALPDMLTFSPDGKFLVVANEGEPNDDYSVDPNGTISVIRMKKIADLSQADVTSVDFTSFNPGNIDPNIRIFGPGATVAQDLEPEYITIAENSRTAFVTLQENNALAEIDLRTATIRSLKGLGFKDHSVTGFGLDASDRDNAINITNWPVLGMFQPDAIASFRANGKTYLITANEGDARDYDTFSEEERVKDLALDPTAFPNLVNLQGDTQLGRLNVTTTLGDTDNDGDYDELYSYGARSFSIWTTDGELVWDSGIAFETILAELFPADFNSDNSENDSFDSRSDNKGPEPEGAVLGKIGSRTYAFIGLERMSGVMIYDVTKPAAPEFVDYVTTRDFAGDAEADTAGDLGPEGLIFIAAKDSPNGKPLLVVANEVSGSTTIYQLAQIKANQPN